MMTTLNKKEKKMTEASASVCLLLAMTLVCSQSHTTETMFTVPVMQ